MDHPHKLVFTLRIPIRWGDMDAMGHVNNTVYFRYAEQARIEWIESLGFPARQEHDQSPVIVNASCTFLIPLTYPGTVEVRTYTGSAGRSSLPTFFDLRPLGDDRVHAEGAAKIVWTNPASGKSIPLPDVMRRLAADQ
ncbi:MAG: acyl-CoA thioesterase [Betaproteobacteria bacterium]|nr:acyl-CoA thioesterase [Betaproteobacteria bacterium]